MKKLFAVSILLALLSTAAFAELTTQVNIEVTQNLFTGRMYVDDLATQTSTANSPDVGYMGPGSFNFWTDNGMIRNWDPVGGTTNGGAANWTQARDSRIQLKLQYNRNVRQIIFGNVLTIILKHDYTMTY